MASSNRLDLVLVPADPFRAEGDGRRLLDDLVADGTLQPGGGPGPRAVTWSAGGFARVSVDRPATAPDGLAFWSNRASYGACTPRSHLLL